MRFIPAKRINFLLFIIYYSSHNLVRAKTEFVVVAYLNNSIMKDILSKNEIEHFIQKGYIRLQHAFPKEMADAALDILWNDLPCDRANPTTWTEPVIRLGMYSQEPFVQSVNTPGLHQAYNQLVGKDKWLPCRSVGTFPVRFPSEQLPMDTGKHVDASFPGSDPNNYFEWRVNVRSKGRALLLLVLYSDVTEEDVPTMIYEGSHIDVARLLSKEGDAGLSFMELASQLDDLPQRKLALATGKAGTVYLCHPFLVHAAQAHRGQNPKFMAQPPLLLKGECCIEGSTNGYSPVEEAIRLGIR